MMKSLVAALFYWTLLTVCYTATLTTKALVNGAADSLEDIDAAMSRQRRQANAALLLGMGDLLFDPPDHRKNSFNPFVMMNAIQGALNNQRQHNQNGGQENRSQSRSSGSGQTSSWDQTPTGGNSGPVFSSHGEQGGEWQSQRGGGGSWMTSPNNPFYHGFRLGQMSMLSPYGGARQGPASYDPYGTAHHYGNDYQGSGSSRVKRQAAEGAAEGAGAGGEMFPLNIFQMFIRQKMIDDKAEAYKWQPLMNMFNPFNMMMSRWWSAARNRFSPTPRAFHSSLPRGAAQPIFQQ